MTQKVGRETVLRRLKDHARTRAGHIDPLDLAESVEHETDRGAVIILGSVVEDALEEKIREKFVKLSSDESARMFGPDGPLGSFSAKIRLAYALGIMDRDITKACDIIREMRNACAHSRTSLSFKDQVLRDALDLLADIVVSPGKRTELTVIYCKVLLPFAAAFANNAILFGRVEAAQQVSEAMQTLTAAYELRASRNKLPSQHQ